MSRKQNANQLQSETASLKDVGFHEISKSDVGKLLKLKTKPSLNGSVANLDQG